MFVDTSKRSTATEIMDDFSLKGPLLRDTLNKLETINKWLGGHRITLQSLKFLLSGLTKTKTYTIIDLGCGHGDMLRLVANWGRQQGYTFKLIGVDANKDAIAYAEELSKDFPEFEYQSLNVFSEDFAALDYDLVLATLFFHHFNEKDILRLLNTLKNNATLGIVINDLQRSSLAYLLFKGLSLFISNKMVVQDGLTSILRAFKRQDLVAFSKALNLNYSIRWKWAFRYQWLIKVKSDY